MLDNSSCRVVVEIDEYLCALDCQLADFISSRSVIRIPSLTAVVLIASFENYECETKYSRHGKNYEIETLFHGQ